DPALTDRATRMSALRAFGTVGYAHLPSAEGATHVHRGKTNRPGVCVFQGMNRSIKMMALRGDRHPDFRLKSLNHERK
ncbi:MAG: hypothetical protein ACE5JX_14085, partial [Acidobacteriota bacterium]